MIDNGAIHLECKTIRHDVSSAAEGETNGAFKMYDLQSTYKIY